MEFKDLQLHPDLQRGIAEAQYITCTPVQEQVLSHAFGGQDLYVQSQTGTGKTAAFLVVIFQRLLLEEPLAGRKALIMAPTRELAVQIEEEAKMLGKYLPFKIGSFYGGVGYTQQQQLLRENAQILVGTPGRVLDLNKSGCMNLMDIAFLVLDEADRMFDMGFYPDLRKLIKAVPPADRRQTMLFSATLNAWVKNLAWEYTKSPHEIEIEPQTVTVEEVDQVLYHVPSEEKMRLLLGILKREKPESAVIFCNTKRYTEIVAKRLRINGYACEFIIGDLPQTRRLKVIDDIKAGKIKYLVATDVAARGLDIESLAMVVNYDLPVEAENYVHRIGRTARAGKTGRSVTLASEQDVYELPAIERYIGKKIPSEIATPDLSAEDKSEGMRIQTEFYGDRREERHLYGNAKAGEGRGARPHGQDRGGERRGGTRAEEKSRKRGNGKSGGEPRKNNALQRNTLQCDGLQSNTLQCDDPRQAVEQDLTQLSFEERMLVYKQKYNSGASAGAENRRGSGRQNGNAPGNGGNAARKSNAASGGKESRENRQNDKGRGERKGRNTRQEGKGEPKGRPPFRSGSINSQAKDVGGKKQGAEPLRKPQNSRAVNGSALQAPDGNEQEKAASQKGFFSRIFGFFRKKKG